MKKNRIYSSAVLAAMLLLAAVSSCNEFKDSRVEQEVDNKCVGLCPSGTCLTTYVWFRKEIVKVWRDDINVVTDSLVKVRQKQADDLLVSLKNCR